MSKVISAIVGGESSIAKVYTEAQLAEIAELTDVQPLSDKTEVIFSTWGMICPSEEEIATKYPSLKAVFYAAGATDAFAKPFLARGVRILSAWKMNAIPVADCTFSMILLGLKNWFRLSRAYKAPGAVKQDEAGPGIYKETVALIGNGAIATRVSNMIAANCDLTVKMLPSWPVLDADALADAFKTAQVVSNHLPNVDNLVGVLDGKLFASMRPNAVFINTGRGRQVNEPEMIEVLKARPDISVLLDVMYPEPPVEGSPLYSLPNVWLTPHIAGSLHNEVHRMSDCMISEFKKYIKGEPSDNEIKPENLFQ